MKVTAWNNGSFSATGTGYGLRLGSGDRDGYFDKSWKDVILDLPTRQVGLRVKLSSSFWRDCPELRSAGIGQWLIAIGHPRWRRGKPPVFTLDQVSGNHFRVA